MEWIDGDIFLVATNVGELETKGIEVDANFLLERGLVFSSSVAWIDATVKDRPEADCYPNQSVAQGFVPVGPGSPLRAKI